MQISATAASGYLGSTALYFGPSALFLAAHAVLESCIFENQAKLVKMDAVLLHLKNIINWVIQASINDHFLSFRKGTAFSL